jgi:hypothetical protein
MCATAAIAISLLVCAHQLGHFLREGKWDKTRIAITVVLIAIPILVIGAVAWLRQWYLSQVVKETEGAWSQGMLFAFATFNLLIFTVATVASYLVHDPTLFAVYRARKQLAKAQDGVCNRLKEIASEPKPIGKKLWMSIGQKQSKLRTQRN